MDYYTLKSPWYWVINVFMIFYALSILAYAVVILNTRSTDTYFPASLVNVYYSQRYVSVTWWALFFAAAHLLMYPFVMMMITFRRSHGCSVFWFSLIFILTVMSSYTVLALGRDYRMCNSVSGDQRDNLCNDKRWCCAPEINANMANACPFSGGVTCPDFPDINSAADLQIDTDFLWLFWPNVIYLLADIAIVLFFLGIFCVAPFPKKKSPNTPLRGAGTTPSAPPLSKEEEDDEEKMSVTRKIIQTSALKYTKPE